MRIMKDSGIEWIGQIPDTWNIWPTKRFFRHTKTLAGKDVDSYERLALTMAGVIKRSKDDSEGLQPEKFDTYQVLKENELVFKLIDLANVKTSRVGLSPHTGIVSPAYIVLTNDSDDNRFYYYYFISMYYNEIFNNLGDNGVRSSLNAQDLLNVPMVDITADVRCRIADFLDEKCGAIDRYIVKQQQVIEKLKAYKQAVITEAVTKGLNPDAPMKDSGVEWIGEIPAHWEVARIKNIATFQTGSTPSTLKTEYFDGELPWYTPSDFNENYILKDSTRSLSIKAKEEGVATIIPSNVVMVIGIGGTAGRIGYSEKECSCNQQITALIPMEIEPKYLMFWMISNSIYLKDTALYTTLPILNNSTIGNHSVLVPTHEEQLKIVKFLEKKCEDINSNIEKKKLYLEKLIEYKKSLIYEAVTGKIEV